MKKLLLFTLLSLLAVSVITSCDYKENKKINQNNIGYLESQNADIDTNAAIEKNFTNDPTTENSSNLSVIGEARAKEIALKQADLTADQVIFEKTELDFDDGVWKYEIEFRQNSIEYDVEIKADDGKIIYYEKDIN